VSRPIPVGGTLNIGWHLSRNYSAQQRSNRKQSNKETMNTRNKLAHGIVLAFFGVACWFVWALLQLPGMVRMQGVALQLPGFTRLCMVLGPGILIALAALAAAYCLWIWLRKAETGRSWVGFLATATGSLFLITLPVVVAIYLPLLSALQRLAAK
jgi:hypothetical protein